MYYQHHVGLQVDQVYCYNRYDAAHENVSELWMWQPPADYKKSKMEGQVMHKKHRKYKKEIESIIFNYHRSPADFHTKEWKCRIHSDITWNMDQE